ncbi:MAG TPA: hypothetical protein VN231_09195 [Allosphingosinicella sp.]|nr:hypothetical protein [Allosphingosinicella sp.]
MERSVWKRLGIAPTDDARAIKKAYSARLKEIDPDSEPQAFIALRDARDAALAGFGSSGPAPAVEPVRPRTAGITRPEADRDVPASPGPKPEGPGRRPEPGPKPRSPWQIPSIEEHLARISAMLLDPGPDSVDADRLAKEGAALLRHPDMGLITRSEEVEAWLGQVILNAMPRSDVLLAPVIAHFGWVEKAKAWNCPWYVEAAVARARDCRYRDQVLRAHGPAMRALAEPPPPRTNALIAWAVAELLDEIRDDYPGLERDFDPATIAWWDEAIEAQRQRFAFRWLQRLAS